MGTTIRFSAFAAFSLLAMPAGAQVVQGVGVTGYVAPRCFAAASQARDSRGIEMARCNGSRPVVSVSMRDLDSQSVKLAAVSLDGSVASALRHVRRSDSSARLLTGGDTAGSRSVMEVLVSPAI